jgi:hypothetical protein
VVEQRLFLTCLSGNIACEAEFLNSHLYTFYFSMSLSTLHNHLFNAQMALLTWHPDYCVNRYDAENDVAQIIGAWIHRLQPTSLGEHAPSSNARLKRFKVHVAR